MAAGGAGGGGRGGGGGRRKIRRQASLSLSLDLPVNCSNSCSYSPSILSFSIPIENGASDSRFQMKLIQQEADTIERSICWIVFPRGDVEESRRSDAMLMLELHGVRIKCAIVSVNAK
eukprot:752524-Hanusia_phi.AAC.6